MGVVNSIPCCTERSKEPGQLRPSKVMSSKVSNIINKLGALDEFTETVRQLNSSQQLLQPNISFRHPWAVAPNSVAAQGAVNLAARLRNAKDPSVRDQYFKAGCVTPLTNFLINGKETDRVHAAIIALLAITENCENQDILDELVQLDTLALLGRYMSNKDYPEGLRMSCASIARSIVGRNRSYKDEFVRSNGIPSLVSLMTLDMNRLNDEQHCQWLLERVNDARDYLQDESGTEVDPDIAKKLIGAGVRPKLDKLRESQDNDIIEDASDVLDLLSRF